MSKMEFATITDDDLTAATGGKSWSASFGAFWKDLQLGGKAAHEQTNYETCAGTVSKMPGATPKDVRATCGLPPAAK